MSLSDQEKVKEFLREGPYAVIGASCDPSKFGNKVLRSYLQKKMEVYPINPKEKEIEGLVSYPNLASLPKPVQKLSIVTPPAVTLKVVEEAARSGVRYLWMQPGAESPEAIAQAEKLGMEVIANGPCVLVMLGFRE